jgi:hypothetical protein
MVRTFLIALLATSLLSVAAGCSKSSPNVTSPSAARPGSSDAAADGSTLKVSPPTPASPINNQQPSEGEVTLSISNATATFGPPQALAYRFEIYNAAGARLHFSSLIAGGSSGTTSHVVPDSVALEGDLVHTWRARAEFEGAVGPWSETAAFIAPATKGYIRGNEMYDPLINGETVGVVHGPVTWVPNVGIRLETQHSYISYDLPQTLMEGEFSLLTTGMPTNTEGGKTKLFAMSEGYADIVTNDRRMTVEKRGSPAGVIAWRFVTHGAQTDTIGAERRRVEFDPNRHYFWRATWRNNRFSVLIKEDGFNGHTIYDFGKGFAGRAYDPDPHVLFVGAPVGRSGPEGASVDHVVVRQVWVSGRPRPASANR